ncbi:MAG: hypothetical protein ETSY1_37165 [Candidatus Entotheonella factor]|uniref:LTD domain-containing protein n=1 Tax=Entotheonella factor TaxID=1429438 RepID=W4L8A1_ENTF1|nr:lamin tail domain-containing protein [Candidatus Entotheonella palauensis]ETW93910.1 MAG: hypothetical protein ETSY1_37165 [Candidatus Entotheonella factor]
MADELSTSSPLSKVEISYIHYRGQVRRVQSDEYVEIANNGSSAVDLSRWRILSAGMSLGREQGFTFPEGTVLQAGEKVRVYTNEIHEEWGGFSFGSRTAIWRDQGDTGTLYDAEGKEISSYSYGDKQDWEAEYRKTRAELASQQAAHSQCQIALDLANQQRADLQAQIEQLQGELNRAKQPLSLLEAGPVIFEVRKKTYRVTYIKPRRHWPRYRRA